MLMVYTLVADACDDMDGRLNDDGVSEVSDALLLHAEVLPMVDCSLASAYGLFWVVYVAGDSLRSVAPAHARYTVSLIEGVKRDSVRCDSVSAARRSKFFCEKEAYISVGLSREMKLVSLSSNCMGFCGGLASGSTGT